MCWVRLEKNSSIFVQYCCWGLKRKRDGALWEFTASINSAGRQKKRGKLLLYRPFIARIKSYVYYTRYHTPVITLWRFKIFPPGVLFYGGVLSSVTRVIECRSRETLIIVPGVSFCGGGGYFVSFRCFFFFFAFSWWLSPLNMCRSRCHVLPSVVRPSATSRPAAANRKDSERGLHPRVVRRAAAGHPGQPRRVLAPAYRGQRERGSVETFLPCLPVCWPVGLCCLVVITLSCLLCPFCLFSTYVLYTQLYAVSFLVSQAAAVAPPPPRLRSPALMKANPTTTTTVHKLG